MATATYPFHVRGEIPAALRGSLLIACSRRHKEQGRFSRWHDSQADLVKVDIRAGKSSRMTAKILAPDPACTGLPGAGAAASVRPGKHASTTAHCYESQPNHGLNYANGKLWATNLLFGAPLEVDVERWRPTRVLSYLPTDAGHPQRSTTSHFAWSLDRRYAYFHQSLFARECGAEPVRSAELRLVELDTRSGGERVWKLRPPLDDPDLHSANFHSAFFFEHAGGRHVGLLKTGAIIEHLQAHASPPRDAEHAVIPMSPSTIWVVRLDPTAEVLQAELLPGLERYRGLALSHLEVDNTTGDGFVLYANAKQADVAEETHGANIYGESPESVIEHYSGMIIEALNFGSVLRYELRKGQHSMRVFSRPYDPRRTSHGHSWLPINLSLDSTRERLFGSFSGFRPRLLPAHVHGAYPGIGVDPRTIRYVPPLLMRFDARTLRPDRTADGGYLSYAEPVAMTVMGGSGGDYVATFAPESGIRVYHADNLNEVVCQAICHELWSYQDSHFRPDPAHMIFVPEG